MSFSSFRFFRESSEGSNGRFSTQLGRATAKEPAWAGATQAAAAARGGCVGMVSLPRLLFVFVARASALESLTRSESTKMCFLQILSTEGRVVGVCWEHLKPQGPNGQPLRRIALWIDGEIGRLPPPCRLCPNGLRFTTEKPQGKSQKVADTLVSATLEPFPSHKAISTPRT
jgi:hypothetical protein